MPYVTRDSKGRVVATFDYQLSEDQEWLDDAVLYVPATSDQLLSDLTAEYARRLASITTPYPALERESWPVQTSEARALLADATAVTLWIDAAAAARGIDRADLAARVVALDDAYRPIHGAFSGWRQHIEDAITAAGTDPEKLDAIDVTAGWPKVEAAT